MANPTTTATTQRKKKNRLVTNHGIILLLALLMCIAKFLFHTIMPKEEKPFIDFSSNYEDLEIEIKNKLLEYEIKIGSKPKSETQKKLSAILDQLNHKKPWNEVIDEIISKSESFLPKSSPQSDSPVTIVTAVFNLGPENDNTEMSNLQQIPKFLEYPLDKIIFVDRSLVDLVMPLINGNNVKVIVLSLDQIKNYFRKPIEDIHQIINNRNWKYQARWLSGSPQASSPEFSILGMAKVFLLREAARLNPWNTKSFLWFDSTMGCGNRSQLTKSKVSFFNQLSDRFIIPYFNYKASIETHGFPIHALNYYLGSLEKEQKVAKTWVLGGQEEYIEVTALVVDILIRQTLRDRQVGNGDCIYTILITRFPRLIHPFNLVSACEETTEYDFSCPKFRNPSHWCSLMNWALEGPPKSYFPVHPKRF